MPRKSTASAATAPEPNGDTTMASEAPTVSSPNRNKDQPPTGEQGKQEKQSKRKSEGDVVALDDLSLPKSIVNRLSKGVLPPNTSIAKDAILALTKSATVFISHLAGEANDMTDRKTIQSADVIKALREIEMEGVMALGVLGKDGKRGGRVEREVERWEGDVRGKRRGYREKVKARESGAGAGDTTVGTVDTQGGGDGDEEREEHEKKRVRIDGGEGRDSSAGPITHATGSLKLNVARQKSGEVQNGDADEAEEDESEEEEDDDDDEEEENEEAEEQGETQDVEADDSIDMEDADSKRKHGTLAPDGRIEVGASDDESD